MGIWIVTFGPHHLKKILIYGRGENISPPRTFLGEICRFVCLALYIYLFFNFFLLKIFLSQKILFVISICLLPGVWCWSIGLLIFRVYLGIEHGSIHLFTANRSVILMIYMILEYNLQWHKSKIIIYFNFNLSTGFK